MISRHILPLVVGPFLVASAFGGYSASLSFEDTDYGPEDLLVRDFLVLGGGASGTYAAVRLTDYNRSVVLVEKDNRLGGCTHTYIDPVSGNTTDIGVLTYDNLTEVRAFFGRFDIPLALIEDQGTTSAYVNFRNGQPAASPDQATIQGLLGYFDTLAQFPYLADGFDLPEPVPEDLLLPLGDYLEKYNLSSIAYFIFDQAQCQGNLLDQPTLYVAKYFGTVNKASVVNGYLTSARLNNSELYSASQKYLGSDVLLQSQILGLRRTGHGVTAIVSTPSGKKLVKAKKLISSISPQLDSGSLAGWDLSAKETSLFGQFNSSAYWTALVTNTGLNSSVMWKNTDPAQVLDIPRLPQAYVIFPTGTIENVLHVYYGSPYAIPEEQVRQDIVAEVQRVQALAGVPITQPEFLIMDAHIPFQCTVSTDAIRKGFYRDLNGLQGELSTFWTGAAFHTHDSSLLWQRTEKLLPSWLA